MASASENKYLQHNSRASKRLLKTKIRLRLSEYCRIIYNPLVNPMIYYSSICFGFFVSLNLVLSLATLTFCDFRLNWRLYLTITVINVRKKLKWKHLYSNVVLHQVAQKKDKNSKNRFMGLSYPL